MSEEFRAAVRRGYDDLATSYAAARNEGDGDRDEVADFGRKLADDRRVLDVGCGGGTPATDALATRHDVVGVDLSRTQLHLAVENAPSATFCQADMTALPFADGAFDALVALHSVIHVPREQHAAVFAEFRRVLRPDAPALVTCGSGDWEGTNPDWLESGTEMRWSFHGPETTRPLLREAGFEIRGERVLADDLGDGAFVYYRLVASSPDDRPISR